LAKRRFLRSSSKEWSSYLLSWVILLDEVHNIVEERVVFSNKEGHVTEVVFIVDLERAHLSLGPSVVLGSGQLILQANEQSNGNSLDVLKVDQGWSGSSIVL
jgi:hypothetical protein